MAYRINIGAEPNQDFECVLGGQNCIITLYQRGGKMFLDLDCNDVPIVRGAICHNNINILRSDSADFRGNLRILDTENNLDPVWEQIGTRFLLYYLSEAEANDGY